MDLPDLLHDALLVQNCGIILRQFTPWGTGVGLHDVYGTIDIGEKLGLADEAFGIPGFPKESIPLIPDLTITLSDVMLDDIKVRKDWHGCERRTFARGRERLLRSVPYATGCLTTSPASWSLKRDHSSSLFSC